MFRGETISRLFTSQLTQKSRDTIIRINYFLKTFLSNNVKDSLGRAFWMLTIVGTLLLNIVTQENEHLKKKALWHCFFLLICRSFKWFT